MKLSIVIVNYNVKFLLEQCLLTVEKACKNIESEIFVIDNASMDGSEDYFKNRFENINFQWNKNNVGFAKANNSVLSKVAGDYVLFLNPDTLVPEDCFEKCIDFFSNHPDCGALGVRMVDAKGNFLKESKRGFPDLKTSFYKMIGLHLIFPTSRLFSKYYEGHLSEHSSCPVDVLSGAFMMLSNGALKKVKGFDEDFFMYGEDIDISCRIKQSGFKNYYFSETTIVHYKGKSTSYKSGSYKKHFYGAMKIFVKKYYGNNLKSKLIFWGIDSCRIFANLKGLFLSRN